MEYEISFLPHQIKSVQIKAIAFGDELFRSPTSRSIGLDRGAEVKKSAYNNPPRASIPPDVQFQWLMVSLFV
jgi:hypothetical protein